MDFELPEELKMVQSLARDFVNEQLKPLERDILGRSADLSDARMHLPADIEANLIKTVREMGLWGVGVPEELGGAGLSTLGICLVEEELAQTVIPFNFGDVTPILFNCNDVQREKFLLPALDWQKKPYMAMIEPESGPDISSFEMKVRRVNGHYTLDGKKISLSRAADDYFAIVFAVTDRSHHGVTCFLVDKGTPGFSVSSSEERLGWMSGIRAPIFLSFKRCSLTAEDILGEEGKAFHLGKKWLPQRRVVRGARSVGIAQRLLDEVLIQAESWQSFGRAIHERNNIRAALADIATLVHAGRLMVYEAAWKADKGESIKHEAAMVKLYATQIVHMAADRVAHVFNGPPYIAGLPMERLCRHALANSATELALDLQRSIISRDILKGLKV